MAKDRDQWARSTKDRDQWARATKRWERVVPRGVAVAQVANERRRLARRLRDRGMTFKEIGGHFGVSAVRARQLCVRANREAIPVEKYLRSLGDVFTISEMANTI